MKKIFSLLLAFALALSLIGCGEEDNTTPEGMKLAGGGETLGFLLYIPEAWTESSYGKAAAGYVSGIDTSSVSLVEVYPEDTTENGLRAYMENSLAKSKAPVTYVEEERGIAYTLGNAERAISYVYTYEYDGLPYRFQQVIATAKSGKVYLFTYAGSDQDKYEGESYFSANSADVGLIMDAIVFLDGKEPVDEMISFGTDEDGYTLVSDKELCGFSLYLPEPWRAEISSGIVLATLSDGSSITMSEATATGSNVRDYYNKRLSELSVLYDNVTEITELTECALGDTDVAAYAEYQYTNRDGEVLRVYQVVAVAGTALFQKGYVFTYTAKEANYEEHLDDINTIMEKIRF